MSKIIINVMKFKQFWIGLEFWLNKNQITVAIESEFEFQHTIIETKLNKKIILGPTRKQNYHWGFCCKPWIDLKIAKYESNLNRIGSLITVVSWPLTEHTNRTERYTHVTSTIKLTSRFLFMTADQHELKSWLNSTTFRN